MRVLWVVVDALGNEQVTPRLMPCLSRLSDSGFRAPSGGVGVLPALTYPNHATFLTGVDPPVHGVVTNSVRTERGWVGAETIGPMAPTLFERVAERGLRSVGVFGDQNLVGVCGASAATSHWPLNGVQSPDAPRGLTGFGTDASVVAAAAGLSVADAALTFVHLDETDAVRHVHGPRSPEAEEQAASVDRSLGELLAMYDPVWSDTVVIVLSDHDQEAVTQGAGIDMRLELIERFSHVDPNCFMVDGTGAYVAADAGIDSTELAELPGVEGVERLAGGSHVLWGAPGVVFGIEWGQGGDHGSPRTRPQVAIVGGGDPRAAELGERIVSRPPAARDWAGWVHDLLRS